MRPIRFNRARAPGLFTRYPCTDFTVRPRPANRSSQANPRKVVLHFRALPATCPPTNPCAGAHGCSPGIPSWSFRPLSVLAWPATYPAECPIPRLCNPFRFFKPLGALLRFPAVGRFVSPALRSWGFVFRAPARREPLTSRFASCPLVVTSRLSSLLRNGRQPGRPPSGPYSPFASGCLLSTAEAQNASTSTHPPDCSPLQSYIASGGTSDFRRRYPRALRNSHSVTAEAISVCSPLCLRVFPRPRNARLSRDRRLSWGSRPRNTSCAFKDIRVQVYWLTPKGSYSRLFDYLPLG